MPTEMKSPKSGIHCAEPVPAPNRDPTPLRRGAAAIGATFTTGLAAVVLLSGLAACAGPGLRGDVALVAANEVEAGATGATAATGDRGNAGESSFGVKRVTGPGGSAPAEVSILSTDLSSPAPGRSAGAPRLPLDASAGELGRQQVELAAAAHRMVDRLVEAGSRLVGEGPLPRSLLIWPVRELGTQRHTVATGRASQAAAQRARSEFRGLVADSLEGWAGGGGDWVIVAGLDWARFQQEGPVPARTPPRPGGAPALAEARLCAVLVDRRGNRVLAHFVQRVDPLSLDLSPAAFHRDLPIVPQTSGSPLNPGLCGTGPGRAGPLVTTASAAGAAAVDPAALPTVAALVQALDLEIGLQRYEAGQYAAAAGAFGRAVGLTGTADIEALAGLAMAVERSRPRQAGPAWERLADAMLERGRAAVVGPIQPLLTGRLADGAPAAGDTDPVRRERIRQIARISPEGEPIRTRLTRRITVATAQRLQAMAQCAVIVAHQDEGEQRQTARAPAYERAYAMARWLSLAGGQDGWSFEIGNVPNEPGLIGTGTSNVIDAWDRRIDVVPANCIVASNGLPDSAGGSGTRGGDAAVRPPR